MFDSREYTVGWICAILPEYVAAKALLDEDYGQPDELPQNDNNNYTLGRIKDHNVVIAVLPSGEYGTTSAASVARDVLHSFPNVRIGLLVGIGGGAPSLERDIDIRLGDIVVSLPSNGNGGVFQYDYGKTIQNEQFHTTGFLDQLPPVLRSAVSGLRAAYEIEGHEIEETINQALSKKAKLRRRYKRPEANSDRLFEPTFVHPGGEHSCATVCAGESSKLMVRREREEDEDNPAVHYGLVASANQLMKDAQVRDRLAEKEGVLCFEMEASGLMNHFPCIVVRGVCDYSDSHKNKEWQGYAAMAAAAYAKDLLYQIPPKRVETEKKICNVLSSVSEQMRQMRQMRVDIVNTRDTIRGIANNQNRDWIERLLLPSDPATNYESALQLRQEGTGSWFLESPEFKEWQDNPSSFLWLHGIPGCGKTILSSTIIEQLKRTVPCVLYFYFTFNDASKQKLEDMIRSLIIQLYDRWPDSREAFEEMFKFN